tara:strand:- start:669 stop:1751 length:1083 start_codon:yes stop_codon:yes gene_type:complete
MSIKPKKTIIKMWRPDPDTSERSNFFRFDRNERTTLFSEKEFKKMLSTLNSYDFVAYGELEPFYDKICKWLNINRRNVLLTSGSDNAIKSVYETFINKKDEVLISLPNYAMYSVYCKMFGGNEVQHFYEEDLTLNTDKFKEKINQKTKLVILSNPAHTGTVIPQKKIFEIIDYASSNNSLVIVDEAYHHFSKETMIDHVDNFDNLIVTRTFSKAFGLASLRIGLLISNNKMIDELYKVKLVHEITGVAAKIGIYLLDNMEIVNNYVMDVNRGKKIIYKRLEEIGFTFFRSEANFVFFKSIKKINTSDLIFFLKQKNIFIKGPFCKHPFDDHLRITIGDAKQMNIFCDAIIEFFNNKRLEN